MEQSGRVDGDTREIHPTRARVPGEARERAVAVVLNSALRRREIDPSIVGAPCVSGKNVVGYGHSSVRRTEVHPAAHITESVFVRRIDRAGGRGSVSTVRARKSNNQESEQYRSI